MFYGCTKLSHFDIPKTVQYIGRDVFTNCTGITYMDIPDSVETIDKSAFWMQ